MLSPLRTSLSLCEWSRYPCRQLCRPKSSTQHQTTSLPSTPHSRSKSASAPRRTLASPVRSVPAALPAPPVTPLTPASAATATTSRWTATPQQASVSTARETPRETTVNDVRLVIMATRQMGWLASHVHVPRWTQPRVSAPPAFWTWMAYRRAMHVL